MANGKDDPLNEARSLLLTIRNQGQDSVFRDSRQLAEALGCTITLIESFHRSILAGQGPDPSSPDWNVVKALVELLVRLGICPHLSPGVGFSRQKASGNASVLAAASAMSEHLSSFAASNCLLSRDVETLLASGSGTLLISAEVLASLIWNESTNTVGFHETAGTAISSLGHLVMNSFLWDMMAAYLQLAFGPLAGDFQGDEYSKGIACERMKEIVEKIPVRQVVEACFVLLHRSSPDPPGWLKSELGKELSKLVMRVGGVAAVLEEVVGRAAKGNVELYDKVAAHLAKTPKSIATAQAYFEAICPQLFPLLLLCAQHMDPKEGEASRRALCNIYFTAVSLACKLFALEPKLAEDCLLKPLLKPVATWSAAQKGMKMANQGLTRETFQEDLDSLHNEVDMFQVTETELVDKLLQISVLLTAGHRGSLKIRETILLETKEFAPLLWKLHSQLQGVDGSSSVLAAGSRKTETSHQPKSTIDRAECKIASNHKIRGEGVSNGSLNKGLEVEGAIGEIPDYQNPLARVRFALADLVMAQASQPVEYSLPIALSVLFQHEEFILRWPEEHGEIGHSLSSKTAQPTAMYVSKLLLIVKNWPLAVALIGEGLQKVLHLRQSMMETNTVLQSPATAEFLRYMQDFETLNNELGSKALEHDIRGAASIIKVLLNDENVYNYEDMLEIVLHMLNGVFKGLHSSNEVDDNVQSIDLSVLDDIRLALKRVYNNTGLCDRVRQMSFILAEESSCFH